MRDPAASTVAFFVAPVVPGVAFALTSPGIGGGFQADVTSILMLSFLGYLWALAPTLVIALPIFLFLNSRGAANLGVSSASGAFIGVLATIVLFNGSLLSWPAAFWGATGAASGALFWYIRMCSLQREQQ